MFWFFIAVTLPLFVTSSIIYFQRVNSIKEEAYTKLVSIRDLKVREMNRWLEERVGDIRVTVENNQMRNLEELLNKQRLTHKDSTTFKLIRENMSQYQEHYTDYNEIFIINPTTGSVLLSTDMNEEGKDKSEHPYFNVPMETRKMFIQDVYDSKSTGKLQMSVSAPILCQAHDEEHIVGIVVMRIDLQASLFDLLLERGGMGKTGETLIVNKDLFALNELRWKNNAPLKLKINAEPAVRASRGETGIVETVDYRSEKVLAAYTHIPSMSWGFVAKQDFSEVYAPIKGLLRGLSWIFGISLILAYMIARVISINIAKPIQTMAAVSTRIAEGNTSSRNESIGNDELGLLAQSINIMADTMESRLRIQERSSELVSTMVATTEISEVGHGLLNKLIELTDSQMGAVYLLNSGKDKFEHFASIGINPEQAMIFDAGQLEGEFGKVLATREITHLRNIPGETSFTFKTVVGIALPKEIITIPLMIDDEVTIVISIGSLSEYSEESLDILNLTWISMSSAFSSLLANEKVIKLAEELYGKNEELQAQTDELNSQREELEQQNTELEIQQKMVEDASRMKSEFLSNMSHELRTPLNSVLSLSSVLLKQSKDKLTDEELNYLEIIKRNGVQLLALINDILDLAKIEAGHIEIKTSLFSLKTTIDNTVDGLEIIASQKGLEIVKEIQDNLPGIKSDEGKIHQILLNIFANAVKFTEQGSIKVSADFDENNISIRIADTGIGIPEDQLSRIFEEFIQVDGTTSRSYEGTGLGLAIAYKTVKLLGGDISVESVAGEGSIFTVTLPRAWQGVKESMGTQLLTPTTGLKTTAPPQNDKRVRILIVEDNEAAIIQVKSVLETEGYIVDVAPGGQEALDYIIETIPDGIILDLMMPDIDGFQVLEQLRSTKVTANIPVLVLTAKDLTKKDLDSLSANNIQQLIQKGDVDTNNLLLKVRLMLGSIPKPEKIVAEKSKKEVKQNPGRTVRKPKSKVGGKKTVLIVEDNPDNMTSIKAILGERFNILEAIDGEKGLQIATTEKPDLILLDIALPKMDGYEVAAKLKENKDTENIPIIAVTASAMMGDREKIIETGFDEYISKPIDPNKLFEKLNKWL